MIRGDRRKRKKASGPTKNFMKDGTLRCQENGEWGKKERERMKKALVWTKKKSLVSFEKIMEWWSCLG